MNFGSKFVYNYSDSEEEYVSDDEFDEGMTRETLTSDSGHVPSEPEVFADSLKPATMSVSSSYKEPRARSSGLFGRLFKTVGRGGAEPPRPQRQQQQAFGAAAAKKSKKKHHWLSGGGSKSNAYCPPPSQGKKWRRADTNVISVDFETLKKPSNMHTGDPFYCSKCGVVLSKLSKLVPAEEDNRMWTCEFCGEKNLVDLVDEEIPGSDDVTFLLSPAACTAGSGRSGEDASLVVFCVDTSGSMCVTTEVPGNVNLRGSRLDRLQSLNDTGESQYLPRQRKNVTYVSRLQGVQAAVDHQLEEMLKEHGSRRVALIAFNSEVTFAGDGTAGPIHVSGDKLSNKEELIQIGSELCLPSHISQTRHKLGDRVFDLEEGGQTALGPALLLSVSLACQVPGSKVIICTDGMANVGLGNLDQVAGGGEAYERAVGFFDEVASMASGKGVSVSVISIKGTDCKMVELGKVADATGGQVNIVDPLKLTQEFGNILADPIIATNVSATLHLHQGLYFRNEESEQSQVTRFVGNVTKSSEVTFEYGVRRQHKNKKGQQKQTTPQTTKAEDVYDVPTSDPVYDNAKKDDAVPYDNLPKSIQVTSQREDASEPSSKSGDSPDVPTVFANIQVQGATGSTQQADTTVSQEHVVPMETDETGNDMQGASGGPSRTMERPVLDSDTKDLPFQLRIKYMDLDGAEALRVITQNKPVTRDRQQAENEMNMGAIGAHACQKSAAMALKGDYTPSRLNAFMYQRLLHRKATVSNETEDNEVYDNFYEQALPMENRINYIQSSERARHGVTYSDSSDNEEEEKSSYVRLESQQKARKSKPAPKGKSLRRRIECDDTSANVFYNNVQVCSKGFKK